MRPNPDDAWPFTRISPDLTGLIEEIHTPRRPRHTPVAFRRQTRATQPGSKGIDDGIEAHNVIKSRGDLHLDTLLISVAVVFQTVENVLIYCFYCTIGNSAESID